MMKIVTLHSCLGPAMFLLYHSEGCNTSEIVFYWCYVNDLHTTHAVVCWVTAHRHEIRLASGAPILTPGPKTAPTGRLRGVLKALVMKVGEPQRPVRPATCFESGCECTMPVSVCCGVGIF
jgi:hypothetical protein